MSEEPIQRIKSIEKTLAKGAIGEAIEALTSLAPINLKPTALGLSARFHLMEKSKAEGVLARENYLLEQNQLIQAALQLCAKLRTHFEKDNTQTLTNVAQNLLKEEKYELALEYFEKAYELNAEDTELLINMASAKMLLGAFNEAIVDLNEAYEKGSTNAYGYYLRATAYEAMGMLDKAAADRERLAAKGIDFSHLE